MTDVIALTIGIIGFLVGAYSWWHARKWSMQCQRGRIAIAYNRRVQFNAPLVEWLQWLSMLQGDEKSKGRVVYRNGKVTVALLHGKPDKTKVVKQRRFTRKPKPTEANVVT